MKLYTTNEIVKCLRIALNDSPRKLDYLAVLSFLEKHKPEDVDEYDFKQEFLFDISNGYFTDPGIRFMLTKMEIIQLKTELDVEEPVPVPLQVPAPSPPTHLEEPKPELFEVGEFNLFDDEIPNVLHQPNVDIHERKPELFEVGEYDLFIDEMPIGLDQPNEEEFQEELLFDFF